MKMLTQPIRDHPCSKRGVQLRMQFKVRGTVETEQKKILHPAPFHRKERCFKVDSKFS